MCIDSGAATEGAISDGKETKGRQEIDQTVYQEEGGQEVDQEAIPEKEGRQAVGQEAVHQEAVHQEAGHQAAARRGSGPAVPDRLLSNGSTSESTCALVTTMTTGWLCHSRTTSRFVLVVFYIRLCELGSHFDSRPPGLFNGILMVRCVPSKPRLVQPWLPLQISRHPIPP
jgi:hypothetical protein